MTNRHHLVRKDVVLTRDRMTKITVLDPREPEALATTAVGRNRIVPRDRRDARVPRRTTVHRHRHRAAAEDRDPRIVKKPRKVHRVDDPDRKPKQDHLRHLALVEVIPAEEARMVHPGAELEDPRVARPSTPDRRHHPREAVEDRIRETPRTEAGLPLHPAGRVDLRLHDWSLRLVPEARRCRHQEGDVDLRLPRMTMTMTTTDPPGEPAPKFETDSVPDSAATLLGRVPPRLFRE